MKYRITCWLFLDRRMDQVGDEGYLVFTWAKSYGSLFYVCFRHYFKKQKEKSAHITIISSSVILLLPLLIDLKTRAVAPFFPDARTFHNIYKLQKHVLLRHQSYLIVFMGNTNLLFLQIMPIYGLNQILKWQTSPFHYGSKFPAVTITVFITILEQNR
jgi:hypothetical protein